MSLKPESASDVIMILRDNIPTIKTLRFMAYQPSPGLNNRLAATQPGLHAELDRLAAILPDSETLIENINALISSHLASTDAIRQMIGETVIGSQREDAEDISVPAKSFDNKWLDEAIYRLPPHLALAICSICILEDGTVAHLPMMDFRSAVKSTSTDFIERLLKVMGQGHGFILDSGNSYHFYGTRLLGESEWVTFLATSLLFAPFVDSRYVAHRLRAGRCNLRLRRSGSLKPADPVVVRTF
jgi:hypothetical protein